MLSDVLRYTLRFVSGWRTNDMLWYRLRQLKSNDESSRRAAIQSLGASKSPHAFEALLASLSDRDFAVRAEAAKALGRIRNPSAIEPLQAALADEYAVVREAVVRALQAIGTIASGRAR